MNHSAVQLTMRFFRSLRRILRNTTVVLLPDATNSFLIPKDTVPTLVGGALTFAQTANMGMCVNTEHPAINDIVIVGELCGMGFQVLRESRGRVTASVYHRNDVRGLLFSPIKFFTGDKVGEMTDLYIGDLRRATGHSGSWICLK